MEIKPKFCKGQVVFRNGSMCLITAVEFANTDHEMVEYRTLSSEVYRTTNLDGFSVAKFVPMPGQLFTVNSPDDSGVSILQCVHVGARGDRVAYEVVSSDDLSVIGTVDVLSVPSTVFLEVLPENEDTGCQLRRNKEFRNASGPFRA